MDKLIELNKEVINSWEKQRMYENPSSDNIFTCVLKEETPVLNDKVVMWDARISLSGGENWKDAEVSIPLSVYNKYMDGRFTSLNMGQITYQIK
jgi:hypothetical protein